MSDLLVSSITPRLGTGTGLRTYGVVAALARHGPVEVAYVTFKDARPAAEYEQLAPVTMRPLRASRGAARGIAFARALARGVPPDLAGGVSPELAGAARSAPGGMRVIADGPVTAAALLPLARRRPVVYLAHNLESGGFRGRRGHATLARFERTVLRTFSESWMVTRADARAARALAGEGIVTRHVPNVVDVAAIAPVVAPGTGRVLFVADFTYEPNREAFAYLTGSVMPALWRRLPQLRLTAAGRGLPAAQHDPRIETPGFVEDLRAAYAAADVVVVPLLRGGGSPLKFIEALAHGLPVVATRHAADLLEDGVAGRDFLAAANAAELAAAIETLIADPRRAGAIGAAGRALAAAGYSVDALSRLLAR